MVNGPELSAFPTTLEKHGWPWSEAPAGLPALMPDGRPWPRITIVTPSYNQGAYLEAAIRSVLLQGYPNLEYLVMDGGSDDGSVAMIRRYAPWLDYWASGRDGGQAAALSAGFGRATGEILGWLNSDDLLHPGALARVARSWAANPGCAFLTGDGEFVDAQAAHAVYTIKAGAFSLADLLGYHSGRYLPQPAVFFSREAFLEAGGLDSRLVYTMDLDLWLRLRRRHTLHYLPARLAMLRYHQDAKTWRDNERALAEAYQVVSRHSAEVGWGRRVRIAAAYHAGVARARCARGLRAYFDGQRGEARSAMLGALLAFPPVACSRPGLQLLLRLLLPTALKRRIFSAP